MATTRRAGVRGCAEAARGKAAPILPLSIQATSMYLAPWELFYYLSLPCALGDDDSTSTRRGTAASQSLSQSDQPRLLNLLGQAS